MKKVFCTIGILVALFSLLQYMLIVELDIMYLCKDDIYVIKMDDGLISNYELEEIAVENDVMFANRIILASGLGNNYVKFRVLNPSDDIKEGLEKSVLWTGTKEIEFINGFDDEKFGTIYVCSNDRNKVENVVNDFAERGYGDIEAEEFPHIKMTVSRIFREANVKIFLLVGVLAVIAFASYYVYRLKEIGILSLNGWGHNRISRKITTIIIKSTLITEGVIVAIATLFIAVRDYYRVANYLYMNVLMSLFIIIVYVVCSKIAAFLIRRMNLVSAVKNRKNTKKMFVFLIIAKIITVALLFIEINTTMIKTVDNIDILKSYEKINELDLYNIGQHELLGDKNQNELWECMKKIPSTEIMSYYRFDYEDKFNYSSVEIQQMKKDNIILEDDEYDNVIRCSYNFIPMLKVKDLSGNEIKDLKVMDKQQVLLVPEHLKNDINDIKTVYYCNEDTRVILIENGQAYNNYVTLSTFDYDPIILVTDIDRQISTQNYLTKKGKEIFENELKKFGVSQSAYEARPLADMLNEMKYNSDMDLIMNVIYLIIALISYIIVTFSVITIYFELKKKQIGVSMLQGIYPMSEIIKLLIINMIIVIILALIIKIYLVSLIVVEIIIYGCLLRKYLKNKAILAIKGE